MFVHLADTLDVVEVSAIKSLIDFLFDNPELTASLGVPLHVHGWRPRNNVCDFFAALWIKHVHVDDACCGVVPCCGGICVFVYILDFYCLLVRAARKGKETV